MTLEDNQREKQGVEEQNRKTGEKVVDSPKAKVERQKNNNNIKTREGAAQKNHNKKFWWILTGETILGNKNITIIPCGINQPMEFIKNFKNNKATHHILKDTEYTDRLINIKDAKDIGKLVCIHTTITQKLVS